MIFSRSPRVGLGHITAPAARRSASGHTSIAAEAAASPARYPSRRWAISVSTSSLTLTDASPQAMDANTVVVYQHSHGRNGDSFMNTGTTSVGERNTREVREPLPLVASAPTHGHVPPEEPFVAQSPSCAASFRETSTLSCALVIRK